MYARTDAGNAEDNTDDGKSSCSKNCLTDGKAVRAGRSVIGKTSGIAPKCLASMELSEMK